MLSWKAERQCCVPCAVRVVFPYKLQGAITAVVNYCLPQTEADSKAADSLSVSCFTSAIIAVQRIYKCRSTSPTDGTQKNKSKVAYGKKYSLYVEAISERSQEASFCWPISRRIMSISQSALITTSTETDVSLFVKTLTGEQA